MRRTCSGLVSHFPCTALPCLSCRSKQRFAATSYLAHPHPARAAMDGICPQKGRQQARRKAPPLNSGGALPSAPGAELDPELVRQTLTTTDAVHNAQQRQYSSRPEGNCSRITGKKSNTKHNISTSEQRTASPIIKPQPFDVFVVLDFEATCEENKRIADPEVIEFPMVLVDARTAQPIAEFQRYVKPVRRPTLSAFCTELTGITQDMVDGRANFPKVYHEALTFLASAGLGDAPPLRSYCVVTCGDWDLKVMLPAQMAVSGQLGVPAAFQRWCNLKKLMGKLNIASPSGTNSRGGTPSGMPEMLRMMNLPMQGRHHSGIDDCRNIAAVLCALLKRGYVVDATFDGPASSMASQATPARWHALPDAEGGSQLPSLESLPSSLADGAAPTTQVAVDVPPRTHARTEKHKGDPISSSSSSAAAAAAAVHNRRMLRVDSNRNAVEELLETPVSRATFSPGEHKTISMFLSTLLRHKADQWRVPITANGYVLVEDALRHPKVAKLHLTPRDVALLVRDSDKQRFRLSYGADDGCLYIAAAQGHSLEGVEPELRVVATAAEAPVAVHGTYYRAWQLIQECGYMSAMTRQHIHFAKGLMQDEQVISGMRRNVELFIYLDVPALLADGIPFYESTNGVLLTPGVGESRQLPLKYVAKVVDRKSGRIIIPKASA